MTTYGFRQAEVLVLRELETQRRLIERGVEQPLNNPLVLGPVGGGKTAIARSACEKNELPLLVINCGENSDATNVSGVPVPAMLKQLMGSGTQSEKQDARNVYMEWALNRYAALACTQPSFLFFDDLDKAPRPVQGALMGVTATRHFRDKKLHAGTLIMGAGNRLGDDVYANPISESLRTRMTIIEMAPDLLSFSEYGRNTGEIHEAILGYLQYKPNHLHEWKEDVNRFPTPRGWWEASQQMFCYPSPTEDLFQNGAQDNWKGIISRKLGDHVANDFWAYYTIIKKVDVVSILTHGVARYTGNAGEQRMQQYAAVFAVSQHLNSKGVEKKHKGLELWVPALTGDMKIALIVQLKHSVRASIATLFPAVGDAMLAEYTTTPQGIKAIPGSTIK